MHVFDDSHTLSALEPPVVNATRVPYACLCASTINEYACMCVFIKHFGQCQCAQAHAKVQTLRWHFSDVFKDPNLFQLAAIATMIGK